MLLSGHSISLLAKTVAINITVWTPVLKKKKEYKTGDDSDSQHSDNSEDDPEYEGMSPEEIEEAKWQKKLYKPTGPDGKGWGDFRKLNPIDLEVL